MNGQIINFAERHVLATRPVQKSTWNRQIKEYRLIYHEETLGKFTNPGMAVEAARFAAAEKAGFHSVLSQTAGVVILVQRVEVDGEGKELTFLHARVRYTAGSYLPRIEDLQPTTARPPAPSA